MNLEKFLQISAGNWFTQRTTYQLLEGQCNNNKAEITIESLSFEHPELISLCEKSGVYPHANCLGTKVFWDNSVDWEQPQEKGSSILVFIPNEDKSHTGKLLSLSNHLDAEVFSGYYILAEDESLTLIIEGNNQVIEERQWFASPNLRLRSSLCKVDENHTVSSFYSEIRRMTKTN